MSFRMAIIGYGGMGSWHHEKIKNDDYDLDVVSIYDIREEAQKKAREEGLYVYSSPEELYQDTSIDLVLVSTPNDTHMMYSISCLKSGKNVICEKPVTLNKAEIEEIYKASEESNKFFTVHQNRRWDSDFLIVRKILEENILNKPYAIESRVQGSRRSLHGWRGYKMNGGGMVLDWGVHLIDQMLNLIDDKVVEVNAHLHKVFAPEVDDAFTAMFRFENEITYVVNIDMNCFILQPRWHLACSDGTAIIENWMLDGKIVKLANDNDLDWSEDIIYTAAGPTRSMAPRPKETTKELSLPKVETNDKEYYNNIIDVLNNKSELIVKKDQILRLMALIDAVFESHEKQQSVKCYL